MDMFGEILVRRSPDCRNACHYAASIVQPRSCDSHTHTPIEMIATMFPLRPIGSSNVHVTPVAMGCWPITGITSLNVTREQSLKTLQAAVESGINFFDTAYCYGFEGESERMIGETLGHQRDNLLIASKCGIHWNADRVQQKDAHPDTIRRQCDESLTRLGTDRIDLYYLHAPDPNVPVEESAAVFTQLKQSGKIRTVGVSNFNVEQLQRFHAVCPIDAVQPHYNMLQREIEADVLPWCHTHGASAMVYWPLLKGLLAGKLARDHVFDAKDGRKKYPMFHGDEYQKNCDFVDRLRTIADELGRTVADVVTNWTIQQPGITSALCGAKRPEQISETATALQWSLTEQQMATINTLIDERGTPQTRGAV